MDQVKKAKNDGMGEDDQKIWSDEIQSLTDGAIANIDKALEAKQEKARLLIAADGPFLLRL